MAKIYTRTGDRGETGLWGGARVPKDAPRVRAYGTVDEAMCAIGAAVAALPRRRAFAALRLALSRTQEELFAVGALLATPGDRLAMLGRHAAGPPPESVARLEAEIDAWTLELKPLRTFILPGGSPPGALLHYARTVCRRAERELVSLRRVEALPESPVVYLNRLSDHLFTAARWVNQRLRVPETPWPGLK
ncbi:MAG: cob(I)yrinic acid a,c-diamide adenosyltransferase [Elusimicrobia bacterium]|nr:cob(I)yrinic acid a,c-diamide adenosyltransferase [Elusimicrobiota bacterium]